MIEAINIAQVSDEDRDIPQYPADLGPFFQEVSQQKENEFKSTVERITQRHHYEIYGSRTKIIEGLCRMVGGLPRGSIYRTITMPSYWTQNNLGPDGRFLAMNKRVAKRGVRIERVFLVSGDYHTLSDEEQAIIRAQRETSKDLKDTLAVKIRIVRNQVVLNFERSGQSVAFISYPDADGRVCSVGDLPFDREKTVSGKSLVYGRFLCLNFISRGEQKKRYGKRVIERQIKKVRIWDPGRSEVFWDKLGDESDDFAEIWSGGSTLTIEEYMDGGISQTLRSLLRKG